MKFMNLAFRFSIQTIASAFIILFVLVVQALAANWVGNLIGPTYFSWAPEPVNPQSPWENGNPKGFREGDTVPVAVPVKVGAGNEELIFQFCLDQNASQTGAFAFTDVEPWNTSHQPSILPDGTPVDRTDDINWDRASDANVWAYNATILSVSDGNPGSLCAPKYTGWRVVFQKHDANPAYIVFGAHIAAVGDLLPYHEFGEVPHGKSAIGVNGVFQIRFIGNPSESGADKTINFKSSDLLPPPTAITLLDLKATSSDLVGIPLVLAVSALVLVMSLFLLRRVVFKSL